MHPLVPPTTSEDQTDALPQPIDPIQIETHDNSIRALYRESPDQRQIGHRDLFSKFQRDTAHTTMDDVWKKCSESLVERDKDMAQEWKDGIDNLLVFAGLFSAVVTAFNVELYRQLSPDPTTLAAHALVRVSAQLGNLQIANNTIISSTAPYSPPKVTTPRWAVWVNALWFASLILSLSAASAAITIRQWLTHYTGKTSSNTRESAFTHYLRYDEGFIRWRVPDFIAMLPVLLQMALVFFLIGLAILLFDLNTTVAKVAISLISTLLFFLLFTTIAPACWLQCPYKSTQAQIFVSATRLVIAAGRQAILVLQVLMMLTPAAIGVAYVLSVVAASICIILAVSPIILIIWSIVSLFIILSPRRRRIRAAREDPNDTTNEVSEELIDLPILPGPLADLPDQPVQPELPVLPEVPTPPGAPVLPGILPNEPVLPVLPDNQVTNTVIHDDPLDGKAPTAENPVSLLVLPIPLPVREMIQSVPEMFAQSWKKIRIEWTRRMDWEVRELEVISKHLESVHERRDLTPQEEGRILAYANSFLLADTFHVDITVPYVRQLCKSARERDAIIILKELMRSPNSIPEGRTILDLTTECIFSQTQTCEGAAQLLEDVVTILRSYTWLPMIVHLDISHILADCVNSINSKDDAKAMAGRMVDFVQLRQRPYPLPVAPGLTEGHPGLRYIIEHAREGLRSGGGLNDGLRAVRAALDMICIVLCMCRSLPQASYWGGYQDMVHDLLEDAVRFCTSLVESWMSMEAKLAPFATMAQYSTAVQIADSRGIMGLLRETNALATKYSDDTHQAQLRQLIDALTGTFGPMGRKYLRRRIANSLR